MDLDSYEQMNKIMYETPLEKYNRYSRCLLNNRECPATPLWQEGRDKALKQIQFEENKYIELERRITELEKRLG